MSWNLHIARIVDSAKSKKKLPLDLSPTLTCCHCVHVANARLLGGKAAQWNGHRADLKFHFLLDFNHR